MVEIAKCRACGNHVSSEALVCPQCGDPNPVGNLKKCTRCGHYVESLGNYNGSSIGIGTVRDICDNCWEEVADIDEEMVG